MLSCLPSAVTIATMLCYDYSTCSFDIKHIPVVAYARRQFRKILTPVCSVHENEQTIAAYCFTRSRAGLHGSSPIDDSELWATARRGTIVARYSQSWPTSCVVQYSLYADNMGTDSGS